MIIIRFQPDGRSVQVPAGTPLLAAARQAEVLVEAPCGALGTCGKCKVRVLEGTVSQVATRHRLAADETAAGWVLACAVQATGDLLVEVPPPAAGQALRITTHGHTTAVPIAPFVRKKFLPEHNVTVVVDRGSRVLAREPGDATANCFGLAVDIGTTTLVVTLVELASGRELATASALNPQARHAQDVLSRIRLARDATGLALLQGEIVTALNVLTGEVAASAGIDRRHIYEAVFSGNTCMLHLAAGIDPAPLGKFPYTPALAGGNHLAASAIGLEIAACGLIYLPPVISAFVGADLTAGILATGLHREKRTVLLIDIGTNGELVLAHQGRLYASSTAAGPAFEGMNITCGMRAGQGAIERFAIGGDSTVHMEVIDGGEVAGICGSGLLDTVAELVRTGIVAPTGNFAPGVALAPPLQERLTQRQGKPVFLLSDRVFLSRGDIRQVQLAKGAIRVGIELLLEHAGISPAAVDEVLIAGSFGYHLRPESLLTIGLLPPEFADRISFVGNTARSGAQALLLNSASRSVMLHLTDTIEVIELAARPDFERRFAAGLGF
jgi:uncharacterized 2Fe-2S/4Fe-4S cluster protein (DUF4445 family)